PFNHSPVSALLLTSYVSGSAGVVHRRLCHARAAAQQLGLRARLRPNGAAVSPKLRCCSLAVDICNSRGGTVWLIMQRMLACIVHVQWLYVRVHGRQICRESA